MKRLFSLFAIVTMLFVTSCQYDDSALTDRVDNLENRVEVLETLCAQLNTNISSLQTIVSALQSKNFITSVEPILKDGKTTGWKISFTNGDPITIYNGVDGVDGKTPVIGVKKASDDVYYWTIDGEWLYDTDGNKVQAQATDGADGADGVTPKFQINNKGYWEVSYDNGSTWTEIGKATGADGTSSDAIFSGVDEDDEYVYFTLADGSIITVPKQSSLSITFDEEDLAEVKVNSEVLIGYTVSSVTKSVDIEVTSSADLKAAVVANDATNLTGYIKVVTGSTIDEYSKVIVFVSNDEKVIMKSIVFEPQQGGSSANIQIINGATKSVSKDGGQVTLEFLAGVECEVVIPDAAKSWISVVDTRALQEHSITLKIKANTGATRSANVTVQSLDGKESVKYTITQPGTGSSEPSGSEPAPNEIWYTSSTNDVIILSNIADFGTAIESHSYSNGKGVIVFNSNLTRIGNGAFRESREITSVIIPNGVTAIGSNAFNQCNQLESVTLPESLTSIEYYAFRNCSSIKEIKLPNTTTHIGTGAFKGCSALKYITIPGSVSVIGQEAFRSCSYMTSATIFSGVTEIGAQAFNGCRQMTKITIPESVTKIGDNAFNRTGLVNVTLPSALTSITDRMFYQCYDLKSVKLGDKITSIGEEAFALCDDIKVIELPNTVTEIKRRAFADCTGLTSINLPNGIKVINFATFENCGKLTDVVLPNTLETIKSYAFSGCSEITSINIPSSTTDIETSVFKGCTKIASFSGNFATDDKRCLVVKQSIIAFAPAGATEYITTDVVSAISENAFYGCTELTSITLHGDIKSIGNYAFTNCSNLEAIYCQSTTPPTAGEDIFDGISPEAIIHVPAKCGEAYVAAWSSYADMIQEEPSDEPEVTVENNKIFYTTTDGNVVEFNEGNFGVNEVSNSYTEGKGVIEFDGDVTAIPDGAFLGMATMTSITLPNSVTTVGTSAFKDCTNLTSVTLSNTLQSIGYYCFENCSSLTTIAIPETVTTIGSFSFVGCSAITSFSGKFATLDGLNLIADGTLVAYAVAATPTDYTTPENVTTIAPKAFSSAKNLTTVTITSNVAEIGTRAFENCTNLATINCEKVAPPKAGDEMFYGIANDAKIYVPSNESADAYKTQSGWIMYANLITIK